MKYVHFLLNGNHHGLWVPMKSKRRTKKSANTPAALVVTDANLNGCCGEHARSLWFEQESIAFRASEEVELTLVLRANSGV